MTYENEKLTQLLGDVCNGILTPEGQAELESILLDDSDARQYYSDYIDVHLAVVDQGRKEAAFDSPHGEAPILEYLTGDVARSQPSLFTSAATKWLIGIATMLLIGFAAVWSMLPTADPENVDASSSIASVAPVVNENDASSELLYVAQVVNVSREIVWGKHSTDSDFLLRIRRGDRISIESGSIELAYYTGAKLILRGPCAFVFTGQNSGRLERGTLTGNVVGGDFYVSTPTARVLDLGTEFGVSVSESEDTDVWVFDGEVEVCSDNAVEEAECLSLTMGMSARVKHDGKIDQLPTIDPEQFERKLSDNRLENPNRLSLVDLLSATSPNRFRLAGVIAPDTGKADQSPWLKPRGPGHRMSDVYRKTDWHPYVDGVFIPPLSGVSVQIDSTGNRVELPSSRGRTWGPIWSRRKFDGETNVNSYEDYWGTSTLEGVIERLNKCETGMIGIHSNVGVTFDLRTIRRPDFAPEKLDFTVSNLDNSKISNPEWSAMNRFSADLRVYVDGELRASRLDFTREDGERNLQIELAPADRFLTFVSSDGGHDGFDHVVIIDPVLISQ